MKPEPGKEALDVKKLEENLLKLSPERLLYMAGYLDGLLGGKELPEQEPA